MSNDSANPHLVHLLSSSPYQLAYTLPLLFLSFFLAFSGTFFMLDRSRSFPPATDYTALPGAFDKPRKRRLAWYLEGGLGGLSCGYVTGLHLATFLSLIIPSKTSSTQLSPLSFLVVWVLSCIFTTLLAGRFRYASLIMSGISGGILTSLAISVIVHPSLTPRIVLAAILMPLLTIAILLFYFIPKFHACLLHPTLRFCTSSIGAFGAVLSISLLSKPKIDGWANAWDRFLFQDGVNWGTGREKGLSAAYGIFLAIGMLSDWALRRWFGECPDEKWDDYLAKYTANMPNLPDRAGIFEPSKSFWERIFSSRHAKDDTVLFPPDADVKIPPDHKIALNNLPVPEFLPDFAHKKKLRTKSRKHRLKLPDSSCAKRRKPVKFGALDELSSSSDDDDEKTVSPLADIPRPPLSHTSSSPTLVDEPPKALHRKHLFNTANDETTKVNPVSLLDIDYEAEIAVLKERHNLRLNNDGTPDYSDHEKHIPRNLMRHLSIGQRNRAQCENSRGFTHRPFLPSEPSSNGMNSSPSSSMPDSLSVPGTDSGGVGNNMASVNAAPVPATSSLIKALDRIALAQKEVIWRNNLPPISPSVSTSILTPEARNVELGPYKASSRTLVGVAHDAVEGEDGHMEAERMRQERMPRWEEFWREVKVKARN